jgi:membrane protease YdiL (CAAX protease family)
LDESVKFKLLLILEMLLVLGGLVIYGLGIFPFPILPLFLVAWASLRLRHLGWRDVGLRRPEKWLLTIGLASFVGVVYQALDILLIVPFIQRLTGESIDLSQFSFLRGSLPALIIFLIISWTEAAFIEEMFFRGYFLNRLSDLSGQQRWSLAFAVIGNALIFGAAHAYQGITGVVDTALAGMLLGLLYLAARRNLWLPILVHGIIDTLGFVLIYTGMYNG